MVPVFQEWDILREMPAAPMAVMPPRATYATIVPRSLSIRLQEARIGKGMSIVALAQMVGLSPCTVAMYENGTEVPAQATRQRLAEALQSPL
jgi:ribosome-binding protein aMBF1 (putative translation factor)